MKLEVKIQLLKFCSAVFNSLFLALGLSVAGCAVWILFGKGNFLTVLSSVELSTVAVGLLIIGGVVVSVSVVGCIGADGEHRFLLLTYLGFLIILVLGQLFVTLLLLINRNKGECCGRTGPADWLKNSYIQSLNLTRPDVLPCSCFSSYRRSFNSSWCSELLNYTEPLYGRGNSSYDQGCRQTLSVWLQENALTILGMDVSLILIQVLQFVVMVYLYRAVGRKASLKRSNRLIDPDHAHLDHAQAEDPDYGEQNDASPDPNGGYIHTAYHHDNQNHNRVYLEPAQGYS